MVETLSDTGVPPSGSILSFDPCGQGLAVPSIASHAYLSRRLAKHGIYLSPLLRAEPRWPTRAFAFLQTRQPRLLETSHPVFDRAGAIAQQGSDLRAGQTLRH
jgi:hypothetical protein